MPSDENFFENPFFLSSLKAITKHANLNNYDVLLVYNQKWTWAYRKINSRIQGGWFYSFESSRKW